jgi:hypothetical protein
MRTLLTLYFLLVLSLILFGCGENSKNQKGGEDTPASETAQIDTADVEAVKLTSGPKQHWFGYYDKFQTDPTGRYVLTAEVDTMMRSPTQNDVLTLGMIDLQDGNKWIPLGESRAWGWQQGCMLQWIPGSANEIIWNDLQDGNYVSHIFNVETREKKTLPRPIYTLSNDGSFALGTEFNRIQKLRPGYGYPGVPDPFEKDRHPKAMGIYKMNLKTGESEVLVSIDEMASEKNLDEDLTDYWHWFNHILISPDDQRFVFLHRWRKEKGDGANKPPSGFITRMVTSNLDGSDRYTLDPSGKTSHFIWKNPEQICMWTRPVGMDDGFYLFTDKTDKIEPVGEGIMTVNGHNTYLPNTDSEWILNDTYPQGPNRLQELYLYHMPTRRKVVLGRFHAPEKYTGEVRCDLHPRSSRDGKRVFFDSTHGGDGRQMYMVDVSGIVGR